MSTSRKEYSTLFRICTHLLESEMLTPKQYDLVKEMIIRRDPDFVEVAGVITHLDKMDDDDIAGIHKFFKQKIDLHMKKIISKVFANAPSDKAYEIANSSAVALKLQSSQQLTYGEVDFDSFSEILSIATDGINCNKFVDLGHGTGKALIMAALLCDFRIVVGVELLTDLYEISVEVKQRFEKEVRQYSMEPPLIIIENGSFLDPKHNHFDADVIFANSTCFTEDMMQQIANCAQSMRSGSRFITFTTALKNESFKVIFKKIMPMSWGEITVFIQEKMDGYDDSSALNSLSQSMGSLNSQNEEVTPEELDEDNSSQNSQRAVRIGARSIASSIASEFRGSPVISSRQGSANLMNSESRGDCSSAYSDKAIYHGGARSAASSILSEKFDSPTSISRNGKSINYTTEDLVVDVKEEMGSKMDDTRRKYGPLEPSNISTSVVPNGLDSPLIRHKPTGSHDAMMPFGPLSESRSSTSCGNTPDRDTSPSLLSTHPNRLSADRAHSSFVAVRGDWNDIESKIANTNESTQDINIKQVSKHSAYNIPQKEIARKLSDHETIINPTVFNTNSSNTLLLQDPITEEQVGPSSSRSDQSRISKGWVTIDNEF